MKTRIESSEVMVLYFGAINILWWTFHTFHIVGIQWFMVRSINNNILIGWESLLLPDLYNFATIKL